MTDPIEPLEGALRASPENVPLRLYLATLLSDGGYWARALDHYRLILEIEPANLDANLGLGKACLNAGDAAGAVRALN
nr:tetratricopeptide repeat protein [Armatimonadota bacterium]